MITLPTQPELKLLWLELTGQCQLTCQHCYAQSSPFGNHGTMVRSDWERALQEAACLGCRAIQFIGGEPTLSPFLPSLIRQAYQLGQEIEIYSNLVSVRSSLWDLFQECHVSIATSFYSADAQIHEQITKGCDSFNKTVKNIQLCVERQIPLRVGMVKIRPDQGTLEAQRFLRELGVRRIRSDRARGVGRGTTLIQESPVEALCGKCLNARCAITPSGEVYPCIMARSHGIGNVREQSLATILAGEVMTRTKVELSQAFSARMPLSGCEPDECDPDVHPEDCDPECDPVEWPPCGPDCCPATVSGCEPDECDPDVSQR